MPTKNSIRKALRKANRDRHNVNKTIVSVLQSKRKVKSFKIGPGSKTSVIYED